jgi:hypothetical protein
MAKNDVPQNGQGSNSARLSDSPLAICRGNADPADVDEPGLRSAGLRRQHARAVGADRAAGAVTAGWASEERAVGMPADLANHAAATSEAATARTSIRVRGRFRPLIVGKETGSRGRNGNGERPLHRHSPARASSPRIAARRLNDDPRKDRDATPCPRPDPPDR